MLPKNFADIASIDTFNHTRSGAGKSFEEAAARDRLMLFEQSVARPTIKKPRASRPSRGALGLGGMLDLMAAAHGNPMLAMLIMNKLMGEDNGFSDSDDAADY